MLSNKLTSECNVRDGIESPSPEKHGKRAHKQEGVEQVQGRLHGGAQGHDGDDAPLFVLLNISWLYILINKFRIIAFFGYLSILSFALN